VAIVLSPRYYAGWKATGAAVPITTPPDNKNSGCFIRIIVNLECRKIQRRKVKGLKKQGTSLVLSLVSTYHPCHMESEHSQFLDTLDVLVNKRPPSELIMGADINANIGHSSTCNNAYMPTLGPHGLPKQNSKGRNLLTLYMSHDLCIMNMYYPSKETVGHGTWTSIPHT
jgi:hypothetical protein